MKKTELWGILRIRSGRIIVCAFLIFAASTLLSSLCAGETEFSFDLAELEKEIEKKPYSLNGYLELFPKIYWLDGDAAFYRLNFYDREDETGLKEFNGKLVIEGKYLEGPFTAYARGNTSCSDSETGSETETLLEEGYVAFSPSPNFSLTIGKKTMKWGKGYAWNPAGFVDRPKNPDDPDLTLEGFNLATCEYIRSFSGSLSTVAFTPVLIPVWNDVNSDFGESGYLNYGAKLYLLFLDTDIDLMFLGGDSKPRRLGFDFSRNVTTNFEVHGEFAYIDDAVRGILNPDGSVTRKTDDVTAWLAGLRYLTERDMTVIAEYYYNGMGHTVSDMEQYFAFVERAYDVYSGTGNDGLLRKAKSAAEGNYGKPNVMQEYLYLRILQKDPFDILYATPAVTWIYNLSDESFSLSPEITYTGFTNLEFRLKGSLIYGSACTEFGEKQNDYRLELRIRYYF